MSSRSPPSTARGCASSPPPAATPTTTSCASTARSRPAAASRRTSRCSARDGVGDPTRTSWRRTSSTSAAEPGLPARHVDGARDRPDAARAWQNGVVMAGLSAGSLCWFDHAITAFHGDSRRVKGLGFLPYQRRPLRREAGAPRGVPRGDRRRHAARLRQRRRRGAPLRRRGPGPRGHVAPPRPGLPCHWDGADVIERELEGSSWGLRRPWSRPLPPDGGRTADNPRHGRRRLHRRRRRSCPRRARPAPHRHAAAEALPAPHRGRRLRAPDPPLLRDLRRPPVRAVALSLFRLGRKPLPLREHLLAQDAIYVGGGSMVNLLAIWREHGPPPPAPPPAPPPPATQTCPDGSVIAATATCPAAPPPPPPPAAPERG